MKAQAPNPQRALCSAPRSPMERQFVKLCDGVIRWNSDPPFRLLPCRRGGWRGGACWLACVWVGVSGCVCEGKEEGAVGVWSVSIAILAWHPHIETLSSPPICTQNHRSDGEPRSQLVKKNQTAKLLHQHCLPNPKTPFYKEEK